MVTITNGVDVFTVTRGAFDNIYSKQGYVECGKDKPAETAKQGASVHTTDDAFVDEVEKKPIASWNKMEIKRYARIFGIDISQTKSINEARDLVKSFMDEAAEG